MVINAERWSENNLFLTLFNVSNGDKHISNFSFLNYQIKIYIYIYIRTNTSAWYQIEYVHFQEWSYGLKRPISYNTYCTFHQPRHGECLCGWIWTLLVKWLWVEEEEALITKSHPWLMPKAWLLWKGSKICTWHDTQALTKREIVTF